MTLLLLAGCDRDTVVSPDAEINNRSIQGKEAYAAKSGVSIAPQSLLTAEILMAVGPDGEDENNPNRTRTSGVTICAHSLYDDDEPCGASNTDYWNWKAELEGGEEATVTLEQDEDYLIYQDNSSNALFYHYEYGDGDIEVEYFTSDDHFEIIEILGTPTAEIITPTISNVDHDGSSNALPASQPVEIGCTTECTDRASSYSSDDARSRCLS